MRMNHSNLVVLAIAFVFPVTADASHHMLLPQTPNGKLDDVVKILYQWGHPFKHQLFDAAAPAGAWAFAPDGNKIDVGASIKKEAIVAADDAKVTAYSISFTPQQRGDFTFVVNAAPAWMEEEQEFWQDSVKVVYHVQTQKGWDAATGQDLEWVPLTRPYGLQAGMVFQAKALVDGKPLGGAMVEIERYNSTVPKELPDDEQITRRVKTDPNGIVTCTLTEAGWWCLSAHCDAGKRERNGKMYPVRQRAIFWVHVDDQPAATKRK